MADYHDLDFKELTHDEAFAIFDEFYGDSRGEPPPVEVDQTVPLTASSQILDAKLIPPDDDDEFAGLMSDLDQFPDAPMPDDISPNTALVEDSFTGRHAPETPNFLAPGPLATSIFQISQPSYSPELPQGDMAGVLRAQPSPDAPSSANKSLMQDEMRDEEGLQSSPLSLNDRPLSRLSLGNSIHIAKTQDGGTPTHGDAVHMDEDARSPADPNDDLPSGKSWNFDILSPVQNTNDTKQQVEDAPTAPSSPIEPTSHPVPNTKRGKRRRKTSSPTVPIPSLEEIRANSQKPPAKKQKAGTPDSESTDLEVLHPKSGELTGVQSHAKQSQDPQLIGAAEEVDSSLTDIPSESLPSPPVTSTPEVRAEVKTDIERALQGRDSTLVGEISRLEDPNPKDVLGEPSKWTFDVLKEDTPLKADSDTSSPKKKPAKGKAKGKSKAKAKAADDASSAIKRGKSASTEPATNTPLVKKSRVGKQELDDLIGSKVLKGVRKMEASPRKTRKDRKDEENAKPDAAGAAKRRQSGGGTKRK